MKTERIIHSETVMDHVRISWSEQMLDTDENMRFICRDMYGLLDTHNEKTGTAKKYWREETHIMIINGFMPEEPVYEDNVDKVMKTFLEHHSNHIIVAQVTPSVNTIGAEGASKFITGLEGVNDKSYTIHTDGKVRDAINDEEVPVIYTKEGPKVGLYTGLLGVCFYSLPLLMVRAFNPELCDDKLWDDNMEMLCDKYEHFGFVSINHYCGFENSCAYIYPNKIGLKLLDQAADLVNKNKGE